MEVRELSAPWRRRIVRHAIRRSLPLMLCDPSVAGGSGQRSTSGGRRPLAHGTGGYSTSRSSARASTIADRSSVTCTRWSSITAAGGRGRRARPGAPPGLGCSGRRCGGGRRCRPGRGSRRGETADAASGAAGRRDRERAWPSSSFQEETVHGGRDQREADRPACGRLAPRVCLAGCDTLPPSRSSPRRCRIDVESTPTRLRVRSGRVGGAVGTPGSERPGACSAPVAAPR